MAQVLIDLEELDAAAAFFRDVLLFRNALPISSVYCDLLEALAWLLTHSSKARTAVVLCGASARFRDRSGYLRSTGEQARYECAVVLLREAVTEAEWDSLSAQGRAMSAEQSLDFALEALNSARWTNA